VGVVRNYESGFAAGRSSLGVRVSASVADDGPYRLRSASDATYAGQIAYGQRTGFGQKLGEVIRAMLRLVLPVAALLASFAGVYLYRDTRLDLFQDGTGHWLTDGHLLVPLSFLAVHLTNRRYGPSYALAQVVVTAALVAGTILFAGNQIMAYVPFDTLPTVREALGFGGAFLFASFVGIVMFDGARGARWWTAPLSGFLGAAIFFAAIFFPAAYAGTEAPWLKQGLEYMGVLAGEGVLLLVPYWMLRGFVPPLSGFGGY
jgi:uncharacterized PurR-regulated membrane protein YhhQ (DUF165 family)